jgi:hypothetical protein
MYVIKVVDFFDFDNDRMMDNIQKVNKLYSMSSPSVHKYSRQIRFAENLNEALPDICLGILFEFFPLPPGCFHVQGKQEVT